MAHLNCYFAVTARDLKHDTCHTHICPHFKRSLANQMTPRNYCLSKISLTACGACLSERGAFLRGADVDWHELPRQLRERPPTCQPFLEDSFSCQPFHLKKKKTKNVGSSVSHSWSGKCWRMPHGASRKVWWPPRRDRISPPGDGFPQDPATYSRIVAWKWSEVIKFGSRWSLVGWTPSVLLFAEAQLTPWFHAL